MFSSLQLRNSTDAGSGTFTGEVVSDLTCTTPTYNLLSGEFVNIVRNVSSDKLTPNSNHLFFNHNMYSVIKTGPIFGDLGNVTNRSTQPSFNLLKVVDFK